MTAMATSLRIGLMLASVRDGAHRWRQISLIAGGLLTTIAILFSWAFIQASGAAEHRELEREVVAADDSVTTDLQMVGRAEFWDKRQFPVVWLSASGPDAPIPPGLERLPDPGTFVVSPAVLNSGAAEALGLNLSDAGTGRNGTIGDAGLRARSEWLVYAAPAKTHTLSSGGSMINVVSFGVRSKDSGLSFETDPAMPSALLATYATIWLLLIPSLMFLISCSVALSDLRDRRARSLHAIGLTPVQVRLVGAVEAASLVAGGSIVAGIVWTAAAGHLTVIPLIGIVLVGGALSTPMLVAILTVVVVVLIAALLGALTIRVKDPAVVRVPRRSSRWAVLPLVFGVVGMVAGKLLGRQGVPVLLGCVLVMTISFPLALPWLVAKLGTVIARRRTSSAWLAGRRLVHSPRALARPAVAVAVLVFTLGSATGLYVLMLAPHDELGPPVYTLDWRDPKAGDFASLNEKLAEIGGVAAHVTQQAGTQIAWFASCDDAARAVGRSACTDAGGAEAVLDRVSDVFGIGGRVGRPPEAQDASFVEDALVITGRDRTVEDVQKSVNFLPAANLSRVGPEPLAPPATARWLGGGALVAAAFLLLCALHSFGNRSLAIVGDDLRLLGLGLEVRQVRAVQRKALLAPLIVAVPAAAAGALLFTWASSDVELAATATSQIVVEAIVVGAVAIAFAWLVGLEQRRRLIVSARAPS